MRGWLAQIAVALIAVGPVVALGDSPASVVAATPGTNGSSIDRFTLRFSEAMAPVGGGDAPLTMDCAVGGTGRWVDPTTYVWDYASPLPGGMSCKATLKPSLKTLAGNYVLGTSSFTIDTGGPYARAVLPDSSGDEIEEDQSFFVATNGPVDRVSVAANAYCTVDGIGERIPVDLFPAGTVDQVLAALGKDDWRTRNFLETAGIPVPLATAKRDRAQALANIVALKCRRPLPPGRDMALVWAGAI